MCSICGIIDYKNSGNLNEKILQNMNDTLKSRGPDAHGFFACPYAVFAHNSLSVNGIARGKQPVTAVQGGCRYTIIFNGEIYNKKELKNDLFKKGVFLESDTDSELVLYCYIAYGEECPKHFNGVFAFAIIDERENKVFFARDRFGIKPFYYTKQGSSFVFASEIKALLKHPDVKPQIDMKGLWQLLFLSPITINGSGLFKDICEIKPAYCGSYSKDGLKLHKYWSLKAENIKISSEEAAEHTKELLVDAVSRQTAGEEPLAVLLSGGLDSSAVSAIATDCYKVRGKILPTYSFEYEDSKKNFKASLFQPQGDEEYAAWLAEKLGTQHIVLTAPTKAVADLLGDAVKARDLPGQADIDSSLLYFCREIKKQQGVILSGECADEIFGGYPWFYREEMLGGDFFPWIHKPMLRAELFKDEVAKAKEGLDFVSSLYRESLAECPVSDNDTPDMRISRQATWLSINWFMASLIERKDRITATAGLEVRVPFADYRILEFIYNVPWSIKYENKTEKALLRKAMKDYIPEKILYRKKSPYPKTHNPEYERLVTAELGERIRRGGALAGMLNKNKLDELLKGGSDTWFGQLMSKPQLIAWLIQFDIWFDMYNVNLVP